MITTTPNYTTNKTRNAVKIQNNVLYDVKGIKRTGDELFQVLIEYQIMKEELNNMKGDKVWNPYQQTSFN